MEDSQPNTVIDSSPIGASDISRTTIVVLVILTLAVSVLGTWVVMSRVAVVPQSGVVSGSSGNVQLEIIRPMEPSSDRGSSVVGLVVVPARGGE